MVVNGCQREPFNYTLEDLGKKLVEGKKKEGRKEGSEAMLVCWISTQRGKRGRCKCVTALISCSRCVIYKADLAEWHARMGYMGVCV